MNRIDIPDYQYSLGCNGKRMVCLALLEKSLYFNRNYRLFRLFYFQKYKNCIGSRNCSNQTKLGFEYDQCNNSVKQKKMLK